MSSVGRNCAVVTRPRAAALSVMLSTSHAWATICMKLPVIETAWPKKNSRKLRLSSELNAAFMFSRTVPITRRPGAGARARGWRRGPRRPRRGRAVRGGLARKALRSARTRSSSRSPLAVVATNDTRRSVRSAVRSTQPSSSRAATMRLMVGGCTDSMAARSPMVMRPTLPTTERADSWVGVMPAGLSWRRRRLRRSSTNRRRVTSSSAGSDDGSPAAVGSWSAAGDACGLLAVRGVLVVAGMAWS